MVFPAYERSLVNLNQEYVSGMLSIELTSISAGLRSSGSIGVGLRSSCSCLGGGYVAALFWIKGDYLVVPQPLWVQLG